MALFEKSKEKESVLEFCDVENEEMERKIKRKPYAVWEVGGRKYRLKLNTAGIMELEKKYKTNLMNIMGAGSGGMPSLTVMLDVTTTAMKPFEHGVKATDVQRGFEKYLEEGGSQLNFYTEIYMNIFSVSGFFSNNLAESMQETLEEAKEIL